ncbi:MAG TPA: NAD-dependent deacylase [Salinarimonas sp.]|jgi:NAD-dependent deacetylase|nr:NAD-dependent deacylase [Salinarimonas sp.]
MNLFILTGAGISAESGLGTFRDTGGLWARFDPMKLATPEGFARDPEAVHAFYNTRRRAMAQARPNEAHRALARLEAALGDRLHLCTQNIDDLHERAGSRRVVHMHGELLRHRCTGCGAVERGADDLDLDTPCPACGRTGTMRPDVVWFGEMPMHMEAIEDALLAADLFVAIGTSGSVYPAAGFVAQAREAGIRTLEINLEPADNARLFDAGRYGPASETVPAWVEDVLRERG